MRRLPAPRVRESVVQRHIVAILRSVGGVVYVLGHPSPADGRRFRGTGQTPGLPDLYAFLPAPKLGDLGPMALWIEVKAADGRLRPAQSAFRDRCADASVTHLVGGLDDVLAFLVRGGWLVGANLPHYKRPQESGVN